MNPLYEDWKAFMKTQATRLQERNQVCSGMVYVNQCGTTDRHGDGGHGNVRLGTCAMKTGDMMPWRLLGRLASRSMVHIPLLLYIQLTLFL